jgi:hypothetical protein
LAFKHRVYASHKITEELPIMIMIRPFFDRVLVKCNDEPA